MALSHQLREALHGREYALLNEYTLHAGDGLDIIWSDWGNGREVVLLRTVFDHGMETGCTLYRPVTHSEDLTTILAALP